MGEMTMWIKRLNKVLDYIEDNLDKEISMVQISRISCMSEFNFQKVFSVLADITLGEYIRRRKLSNSSYDLLETDLKIIDIAAKYGYDSVDSYTRSFKKYFQKTPVQVRKNHGPIFVFPKLSISVTIKGGNKMKFHIVEKEEFRVVGVKRGYKSFEEGIANIGLFWDDFNGSMQEEYLDSIMNDELQGYLGLCVSHNSRTGYDYYICVNSTEKYEGDYLEYIVPKSKWIVFDAVGKVPDSVQYITKQIYENFLPSSEYKHAGTEEFELYALGNPMDENYLTQIWIPVVEIN